MGFGADFGDLKGAVLRLDYAARELRALSERWELKLQALERAVRRFQAYVAVDVAHRSGLISDDEARRLLARPDFETIPEALRDVAAKRTQDEKAASAT